MAFTPSFPNSPTMKKLNVNGSVYWLKDSDVRNILATFGDAVLKNVDTTFDEDGVNLATEAATAAWLEEKIAGLTGAMHFEGVIDRAEGQTDRQAIDAHYEAKGRVPNAGDVVVMGDTSSEYICSENTAKTVAGATWREIGAEGVWETKAHAEATYVPKTTTVAGIDLADNITVAEMETALDLKALSHKDSATGTISTADSIEPIAVAKAGAYTVSGDSIAVPATYNALDVTPSGDVDVTAGTAAAVDYDKTTSITVSATPAEEGTANYTPAGSVALPSLTTNLTLAESSVATVTDAGTAYTLSDGNVTKGDDTTAKFVKKGVSIAMNATDAEQLDILYVTNTDTEFYADAVTAAGDITYTKQTISGSLPTFGEKDVVIKTGTSATSAYSGDASFTGVGTLIGATPVTTSTSASVTQPTFTASFSGTSKTVTPTVATTTSAQAPNGTITVTTENITPTLNKTDKTITVQ